MFITQDKVTLVTIDTLFHVAIKTQNLIATQRFYTELLGMTLETRPPVGFPGIWLRGPLAGGSAILHIYAGDAALEADGSTASGTGVIDHVSITAVGFDKFRRRFAQHRLAWRENVVPGVGLWQLFVYDPSAVLIELTFSAAAEEIPEPQIPMERRYRPREVFFQPDDYAQFLAG